MCLLLLVYIYAENNKWDDSWFHIPVKYNITSLLKDDNEEDVGPDKPAVQANDTFIKNGKTSKKNSELKGGNANDSVVANNSPPRATAAKTSKEVEKHRRHDAEEFRKKGNK